MTLAQDQLRDHAWTRLRAARPDLVPARGREDLDALLAVRERIVADDADTVMVVNVLRRFEPGAWIRDTCVFALGLTPESAATWRRFLTRAVFLAGNPGNLGDRFAFDHVAADGSAAWCDPAPAHARTGLRRLLKLFGGSAPFCVGGPPTVAIPGAGRSGRPAVRRDLYLATDGVDLRQSLVHLHHLLVEAVMDELIAPGDQLTLRPEPRLAAARAPFAAVRVDVDPAAPHRLQAFAALTLET